MPRGTRGAERSRDGPRLAEMSRDLSAAARLEVRARGGALGEDGRQPRQPSGHEHRVRRRRRKRRRRRCLRSWERRRLQHHWRRQGLRHRRRRLKPLRRAEGGGGRSGGVIRRACQRVPRRAVHRARATSRIPRAGRLARRVQRGETGCGSGRRCGRRGGGKEVEEMTLRRPLARSAAAAAARTDLSSCRRIQVHAARFARSIERARRHFGRAARGGGMVLLSQSVGLIPKSIKLLTQQRRLAAGCERAARRARREPRRRRVEAAAPRPARPRRRVGHEQRRRAGEVQSGPKKGGGSRGLTSAGSAYRTANTPKPEHCLLFFFFDHLTHSFFSVSLALPNRWRVYITLCFTFITAACGMRSTSPCHEQRCSLPIGVSSRSKERKRRF